MLDALLRKPNCRCINSFCVVIQKQAHTDSLVQSGSKIKTLVVRDKFRKKSLFKPYFIENLFLNRFQNDILEYPELDSIGDVKDLQRHYDFAKKLMTGAIYNEKNVNERESEKVALNLKKFEFCGFKLPKLINGFGYLESEYTYIQEALALDPSVSKIACENEDFGIQLINLFGNTSQKETYLRKLASGEIIACFAHLECGPLASLDPVSVNMTAVESPDGKSYIVSGKKNWVYNSKFADIIIFSANIRTPKQEVLRPTLFLVDKNLSGIKIGEPMEIMGLKDLDISEVIFNDVVVSSNSILGNPNEGDKLVKKILTNGKINNGAQCISIMKRLVNSSITHCIDNKIFNKNKFERDLFNKKISDIVCRLYTVESMTYLVTGRVDSFEDADVFLESLIVKIYASESLQYVLQETLSILGADALEILDFDKIIKYCQFFSACEDTNDYLRLVLSTAGCKHVLKYKSKTNTFTKFKDSLYHQNIVKKLNFNSDTFLYTKGELKGYLHRLFDIESELLEDCVFNLKENVNNLLKNHDENIFSKTTELKLLADLLINIYALTAILGRASRAYCLALRNQEIDLYITQIECYRLFDEFIKTYNSLKRKSTFEHLEKFSGIIENNKNFGQNYPIIRKSQIQKSEKLTDIQK